ncbi:MAG: hypothetical protein JOZ99_12390 [Actinobacteria bacterium]|nr:hypothetical protein [Actinomycetota bacterium]
MSRAKIASVVAGLCFAGATALVAAPAGAASYPNGGSTPTTVTVEGTTVPAPAATHDPGQSLPFTGGDVAGLAGIGMAAVAVGGAMASRGRRRHRQA